ncbi:MAG: ABC transporter permease [Candidatus Nanohaloarchaea archaeon]
MLSDYLLLALRSIRHRKRRSWLTIIGTLIGIMAVVSLVSIGQGLEGSIQREFERLGGDKLFITPGGGITSQFSSTTVELTDDDIETVRNTRGVEDAAGILQGSARVEFADESRYRTLLGIPSDESMQLVKSFNNIQVDEGRFLRPTDTSVVVVGSSTATAFEKDIHVRSTLKIKGEEYRVVGIAEQSGNPGVNSAVMVPRETARKILERPDTYDGIVAQVKEGFSPKEIEKSVSQNLRQARDVEKGEEDFQVQTSEDLIRSFTNQIAIVRAVFIGIGSISLLVGGIGIMNTMYTSVTERTREIGVMKAVGATSRQVMVLFLFESGLIGMVGGILGATLGLAISWTAAEIITSQVGLAINPYFGPELVAGALLFSFTVGMVSGVLPARKASKMKPVEALRYR